MTYVPPDNHVVRHVKSTLLIRNSADEVVGCFPQAFELRVDEASLSVSWLEYYDGSRDQRLRQVKQKSDREIRRKDALAVGNVGRMLDVCAHFGVKPRVVHEPTDRNPAHSAIRQFPRDNLELLALIADLFSGDLNLAASI